MQPGLGDPRYPWHQPGPPPGAWGAPPPRWAQPRSSRAGLFVALALGVAVLLVAGVAAAYLLFGRSDAVAGSPTQVVKRYLQALSNGDAQTALSLAVEQPASKEFLTAEVLKKQLARSPISHIEVSGDDESARQSGKVHASAEFGSQNSDATLEVTKVGSGGWKLKAATVALTPASNDAVTKTIKVFGKPLTTASAAVVFPGSVDIESSNPFVTVTAKTPLLEAVSAKPWPIAPSFALTDRGRDAVRDQLDVAVAACEHSKLLAPPGCPFHLNADDFVEGSASWSSFDTSGVSIGDVDAGTVHASFSGPTRFQVTATTALGVPKIGILTRPMAGSADLTKTPPELTFS